MKRYEAIAKEYVSHPGALVVSPDNESRQTINSAVRAEMRKEGQLWFIGQFLGLVALKMWTINDHE